MMQPLVFYRFESDPFSRRVRARLPEPGTASLQDELQHDSS
ncbi:MAG: hypothetical protein ACPGZP_07365 [Panacagrimonas sp.]